jgi:hypothetical protein
MTAVAVEIGPKPPVIRPDASTGTVKTPVLVSVGDLDAVMESAKCSCAAGDDNPF